MSVKRAIVRAVQKRLVNPLARFGVRRGWLRDYVLLETIGRRSGQPRQTPVGMKIAGDVGWVVAEHGRHADYVRNLEANPQVRVRAGGRWRTGTAHIVDDDDPIARLHALWGRGGNTPAVRAMGTELLSIRVDLDPT